LTTAFVAYGTAQLAVAEGVPGANEALVAARESLFSVVNQDVLYLVYIGLGMFAATFIYMATWIYTGEATTRRIREQYLAAILRQNVAYFDKMGAGEVTTRIETDTHLIQEGLSDKVPITAMFVSIFFTGLIVALVRNWRLALVVSTIVPCIAGAGWGMNKFMSEYRQQMLEETAEGGTLAEEVISSVRNAHAFGTQKKLAELYDVTNKKTLNLGLKSSVANALGMGTFFFSESHIAFRPSCVILMRPPAVICKPESS
jgi:ATP-binding cassette subfamily B (MDR/TAP) protein 1